MDSIYEYEMKAAESSVPPPKKSRYIDALLKAADKRKKEYERRIDKKIQVEREKEGDLYKDKEAFVTSSYKKKLQEKEEEEERERRENMLNDMMDISKQKDLSGFYRHFLKQTVGEEKVPAFGEKFTNKELSCKEDNSPLRVGENSKCNVNFEHTSIDQDSDSGDNNTYSSEEASSKKHHSEGNTSEKRNSRKEKFLRSRAESHSVLYDESKLSLQDKNVKTCRKRKSNSFSSDSDSNSNEDVTYNENVLKLDVHESSETNIHRPRHDSLSSLDDDVNKKSDKEQNQSMKKSRKDIYAKRAVGDVFIAAQTRYFQRMALKPFFENIW